MRFQPVHNRPAHVRKIAGHFRSSVMYIWRLDMETCLVDLLILAERIIAELGAPSGENKEVKSPTCNCGHD